MDDLGELACNCAIIIPVFNCGKYITDALRSIERQTLEPGEVVVVDDGSTDDTARVVQRFADASPLNIMLVRQHNRGLPAARNAGVARTNAEVLIFLDGDDMLAPKLLEKTVGALHDHPNLILCFTDHDWVEDWLNGPGRWIRRNLDEPIFRALRTRRLPDGVTLFRDNPFPTLVQVNFASVIGLTMRREHFELAGRFDEELLAVEDAALMMRLAKLGPFGFIDEPLATRRRHASNMSSNSFKMHFFADIALTKILRDAEELGLTESELAAVRGESARMPGRMLYFASNTLAPGFLRFAYRLAKEGRIQYRAIPVAGLRYAWRYFGRLLARA